MRQDQQRGRITVVYKSVVERGRVWTRIFAEEAPEIELRIWPEVGDTSEVRYLVAWLPPDNLAERFPKLEVLFASAAGVDQLNLTSIPEHIPVVRMIDPALTASMVDYATFGVLALHRDIPLYLADQRDGRWDQRPIIKAADRTVGVMGLGVLGGALVEALRGFGFRLRGWSGSHKTIEGLESFAGEEQLEAFLEGTEILVCLLPLTDTTRGILNAKTFAALPRGAKLLNVGRGGHLVEADLLAALETGQVESAVLDVLAEEPPPPDHPLLRHRRVMVTPHIASATHPESAARRVLAQIKRHLAGEDLADALDRKRGY